MQLEQLRYLILIHRLGSINKASEQVHLSQQALNTSMKKLEAEIGCPLFIYHARGMRLTDLREHEQSISDFLAIYRSF